LFKRGVNDIWLYNDIFRLDYVKEYSNHFSYSLGFKKWNQSPAGALLYQNLLPDGALNNVNLIKTTELSAQLRWAPHERFYQGKLYRVPIPDKYPIFTLNYTQGIAGFFGGQYNYQNVIGNISKRFYFSQLGYTDVTTEGGYLFGKVPFPLLDIHHANQTYAFQLQSYNLMNFQEFVSDHYASIFVDHNFNGFFFNKVPLLKKLKLREIIDVKALWGGVRSENNPSNDPSLLRFPTNIGAGGVGTYTLGSTPYVEGSVGVGNIFKLLRVDLVKRFTYLDNPGAPEWGIRFFVKFDF
ncbi:MAG: carboxypeptidase-like regulatory domain-containing protein, partial [Mucilaginibacter sp.]|nr:carboxypeptidase-like regulatory domain-containing protein [Mucilaginibacter sp.]